MRSQRPTRCSMTDRFVYVRNAGGMPDTTPWCSGDIVTMTWSEKIVKHGVTPLNKEWVDR